MKVIEAWTVNEAVSKAIPYLLSEGVREQSRNGDVLVAPGPVCTEYTDPCARVLYSATRDANPYFHLMEALWMLAGRNDLDWPAFFVQRYTDYSDNGRTVHGAYGYRWRRWFGYDQLAAIVQELHRFPRSRRAVLTMWTPNGDLMAATTVENEQVGGLQSRDVPCNTQAYFDLRYDVLNMTVCNRSNDAMWGAYGANVVHFSVLQEYLAAWLNVPVGTYRQFSNNLHIYTEHFSIEKLERIARETGEYDVYQDSDPYPLVSVPMPAWHDDLTRFLTEPFVERKYNDNFFNHVAKPMFMSWYKRKTRAGIGLEEAQLIMATDWRHACLQHIVNKEGRH